VAKPLSVYVDTARHRHPSIRRARRSLLPELDGLTPRGIRTHLGLNKPIYARTAAYGHFGRKPDKDGGFSLGNWRKLRGSIARNSDVLFTWPCARNRPLSGARKSS
jgi:S-adenosylmethionine synthetase